MTSSPNPAPASGTAHPGGWRTVWTRRRAGLWLVAAAVAVWLPIIGVPLRGWLDFSAFYTAGQLAFTPAVTELAPVVTLQSDQGLPITPFVYPAGVALPYALLSGLPYDLAAAFHVGLMLALLLIAAGLGATLVGIPLRWAVLGTLAWAPAAAGVLSGQNTALALLLVVLAGWALARGRDGRAGIAVGVLAYKPQLAAPLLGLLLLRMRWTALLVAGAMMLGHWLAGTIATGGQWDWPIGWLASVEAYQEADFLANGWQAISLPALGMRLELTTGLAGMSVLGYVLAGAVVLLCVPALRRLPVVEAVALAAACGLLVSPHAWVYDATLLLPALGVYAARAARRGWPWQDRWWLALAFGIALLWSLGGFVGVTLMPVVVIAVPFALLEWGPFQPTRGPAGQGSEPHQTVTRTAPS